MTKIQFMPPPVGTQRQQSDLVLSGPLAFASGLIGSDLANDAIPLAETVEVQARKILRNLDALLSFHDLSRRDVVAVNIWLKDFHRFHERLERIWPELFPDACRPTCQMVGVIALRRDALISMDFVIARGQ